MNTIAKTIIIFFLAITGAIVVGAIMGFIIGPIDTSNSNVSEAIAEIGETFFSQTEESETPSENEPDNESDNESDNGSANGIRNIVRSRISNITGNTSDNTEIDESEDSENESETLEAPHPIVGSWETTNLVEVDIETTGNIAEITHFFNDGTGVELHNESSERREFTWRIENNRLTIIPVETSFRITTNSIELSDDTLTIFYNRNRTSYSEATRVRDLE